MAQKEQHFISLLGVFLALIFGGAAGFLLFAWGAEEGTTASNFFESDQGLAWLVVMMAQCAVLGLAILLTSKKTLWLFRDVFIRRERGRAIASLALYLAAYVLLLWFPQRFIQVLSARELPAPIERMMPLAHFPAQYIIFTAGQLVVVLLLLAGIWLADWRIRNKVATNGSEEECLSALLESRSDILKFGALLTTLAAFSFLGSVLFGEALKPYVPFHWFSRPPLLIYGFYLSVLVAIPYLPAYLNLLAAGREVRDRFYPRLSPGAPDYADRDAQRKRVDELLSLRVRVREGLKILTTIFVPVATSLVYAFLGLKQSS